MAAPRAGAAGGLLPELPPAHRSCRPREDLIKRARPHHTWSRRARRPVDSPGEEGRCLTCWQADFKLIKAHPRDDPGAGSAALLKATQAPHKRLLRKVNNSGGCASWPGQGRRPGVGGRPGHLIKVEGRGWAGLNLAWKLGYKRGERSVGQGKLGDPLGCSEGPVLHVGDRAVIEHAVSSAGGRQARELL